MAIVTGELYKGFTFGDISSKTYGVYITQEAAYNAPERDTEVVEIAGRNGAYILDKGRYKNITVSYKCGIALDSEQTFESAIRTFRNALSAKAGKYVRLEDEYNPNEYRQAAFLGGIDVNMTDRRAGEFTVSFDAKPQRFLKSGETAVTIGGSVTNTQTESGSVVSIESDGGDAVTSLVAQIEPVQAGSGDPSPTNVRPITGWTAANVFVMGKNLFDKSVASLGKWLNISGGLENAQKYDTSDFIKVLPNTGYYLFATGTSRVKFYDENKTAITSSWDGSFGGGSNAVITTGATTRYVRFSMLKTNTDGISFNYPSTDHDYHHYTGHTTTVPLGQTVYGGTVDVTTGVMTLNKVGVDMGSINWSKSTAYDSFYATFAGIKRPSRWGVAVTAISSMYTAKDFNYFDDLTQEYIFAGNPNNDNLNVRNPDYSDASAFKTAMAGQMIVYDLATPTTVQLTPTQVASLLGTNNVWADCGPVEVEYRADPTLAYAELQALILENM